MSELAGTLHNTVHGAIGDDCSPNGTSGQMSFSEVSGRDPIFWKWHQNIEDLVQGFTDQHQTPYNKEDFDVRGNIEVGGISTILTHKEVTLTNQLVTYMEVKSAKIREEVIVKYNRLNHLPFKSKIKIINQKKSKTKIMVRIFLAALKNEDDPK